jgi:hypothetical protein
LPPKRCLNGPLGNRRDAGDMSDEERRRLHESFLQGIRDGRAGREMDFDDFMDQLDAEP